MRAPAARVVFVLWWTAALARGGTLAIQPATFNAGGAVEVAGEGLVWTGRGSAVLWLECAGDVTGKWVLVGRSRQEEAAALELVIDGEPVARWELQEGEPATVTADWEGGEGLHQVILQPAGGEAVAGMEVESVLLVTPGETSMVRVAGGAVEELRQHYRIAAQERAVRAFDRTRRATLRVEVDRSGIPAAGVPVRITQQDSDYELGFLLDIDESGTWLETARVLASSGLFSGVLIPGSLSWRECEPEAKKYEFGRLDRVSSEIRELGLKFYTGPLVSQCASALPEWAAALPDEELREAVLRWSRVAAAHLRKSTDMLTVLGDLAGCDELDRRFGLGLARQMVYECGMVAPKAAAVIDAGLLRSAADARRVLERVGAYQEAEVGMEAIGAAIPAKTDGEFTGMGSLRRILSVLSEAELPLIISLIPAETPTGDAPEPALSTYVVEILSYPKVGKVFVPVSWLVSERGEESVFPSEQLEELDHLLRVELRSLQTCLTDENGAVEVPAYRGRYRITVGTGDEKTMQEVELQGSGLTVRISLPGTTEPPPQEDEGTTATTTEAPTNTVTGDTGAVTNADMHPPR